MQYLLLARHGNTFAPGQKVVCIGANNDLPLVESGIAQAHVLAHSLKENSLSPTKIYSASLQRALTYAQIIGSELKLSSEIQIDSRLNEIDYGSWSGLSEQEIKEKFGSQNLEQWNTNGIWPDTFGGLESVIASEVLSFAQDIIEVNKKVTLAVTSNGRLKYFLKLLPDTAVSNVPNWKVRTGHVSVLAYEQSLWKLICWNETPQTACSLIEANFKALAGNT